MPLNQEKNPDQAVSQLEEHQIVIDADTLLVDWVGRPLAGNRNDCKAWVTIADGGYPGTGLVIPHRRKRGQTEFPDWKEEHNRFHKQVPMPASSTPSHG